MQNRQQKIVNFNSSCHSTTNSIYESRNEELELLTKDDQTTARTQEEKMRKNENVDNDEEIEKFF